MAVDDEREVRSKIAAAVRSVEVTEMEAWQDLSVLSSNTIVDNLEIFEDEIQLRGTEFTGPILWHVTLEYGGREDRFTSADSFPGKFSGERKDGNIVVTSMTADTTSFYE